MRANVLTILNLKGGTGKTTTVVNLGASLAKLGKRVLLVDLDPQGSLTYHFGVHRFGASVAEALLGEVPIRQAIVPKENLWIVPADLDLSNADLSLATYRYREGVLRRALEPILYDFDYVLIDCSPALSLLNINSLNAADYVLVPMQLEVLSLKSLNHLTHTVQQMRESLNDGLRILGVVPVMVATERSITQEVYEYVRQEYRGQLLKSYVRLDEKAVEAPSFGKSAVAHAPDSKVAEDYLTLALEVITLTHRRGNGNGAASHRLTREKQG